MTPVLPIVLAILIGDGNTKVPTSKRMNSKTCSRWLDSLLIFHGQGMLHDVDRRKSITASMNSFPWQRKNELIQLSFNLPHVDINTMARSNMVVPSLG